MLSFLFNSLVTLTFFLTKCCGSCGGEAVAFFSLSGPFCAFRSKLRTLIYFMYYVYYPIHIYDYRYIFKHWRLFKLWFINNVVFLVSYRYRVFVCISVHLSCKLPRGRYGKRFVSGLLAPSFLLLQRYFQAKMSDLFVLDIGKPPKYCPQCEESGLLTKVK